MKRYKEKVRRANEKAYAKRRASPELLQKHADWIVKLRREKPHEYAIYRIRNRYKVSVEEAERLLKQKQLGCEACGVKPTEARMHIDHDHKTGKVRGILCHHCNVVLGMVGDDINHIEAVICYMERNRQR